MPLPKPLSDIKNELGDFVAASEPQNALKYLQDLLPNGSGKHTQATLIQSKLSNANQKYQTGQIKFDDQTVEIAQVAAAILDMANSLSESDFDWTPARPIAAIPKFVVIYNELDKPHFEMLQRQLSVLKRFNKIRYYDVYDIEAVDLVKSAKEEIADADYLLVLITPDLFNEKPIDWFAVVSHALGEGRRMIPLRIKNLGFEIPELEKLKSLPSMGNWVSDLPNKDSAYAEIVGELRKLLPK
ncbi:MAG: toll/interleukin-1 receptor domain-containing protein [Phycisphaerae bacterium]|nr:toll/interleukin-1 receptor domain-containing protein [Saprospiraceae bacterium]